MGLAESKRKEVPKRKRKLNKYIYFVIFLVSVVSIGVFIGYRMSIQTKEYTKDELVMILNRDLRSDELVLLDSGVSGESILATAEIRDRANSRGLSEEQIREELIDEGFTKTSIDEGVDYSEIDWLDQAVRVAHEYMIYNESASTDEILAHLEGRSFSKDIIKDMKKMLD